MAPAGCQASGPARGRPAEPQGRLAVASLGPRRCSFGQYLQNTVLDPGSLFTRGTVTSKGLGQSEHSGLSGWRRGWGSSCVAYVADTLAGCRGRAALLFRLITSKGLLCCSWVGVSGQDIRGAPSLARRQLGCCGPASPPALGPQLPNASQRAGFALPVQVLAFFTLPSILPMPVQPRPPQPSHPW